MRKEGKTVVWQSGTKEEQALSLYKLATTDWESKDKSVSYHDPQKVCAWSSTMHNPQHSLPINKCFPSSTDSDEEQKVH